MMIMMLFFVLTGLTSTWWFCPYVGCWNHIIGPLNKNDFNEKNTTATLSTLPPLHFRNLNRDSTSMTFSLMGRPAGHFLSTLMKAEILHPAAFLVKHFSEKKMPKLLPNFTQGRLAHISNTEKKYQSHEFVSYLSHRRVVSLF